jgi:hypothetical protein
MMSQGFKTRSNVVPLPENAEASSSASTSTKKEHGMRKEHILIDKKGFENLDRPHITRVGMAGSRYTTKSLTWLPDAMARHGDLCPFHPASRIASPSASSIGTIESSLKIALLLISIARRRHKQQVLQLAPATMTRLVDWLRRGRLSARLKAY